MEGGLAFHFASMEDGLDQPFHRACTEPLVEPSKPVVAAVPRGLGSPYEKGPKTGCKDMVVVVLAPVK